MALIGARKSTLVVFSPRNLGSDQEEMLGPTTSGLLHRHIGPERLLLWDTKLRGWRPDTMKVLKEAYDAWGAEGDVIRSGAL